MHDVSVVVSENSPPAVTVTGGGLAASGWRGGLQHLIVAASDPVGIRELSLSADGTNLVRNTRACDSALPIPCPNGSATFAVNTRLLNDGWHKLRVQASDSASNTRSVDRAVLIDNHPPAKPDSVQVDGGSAWRSTSAFTLRWVEPRQSAAPVTRAYISVCPMDREAPCTGRQSLGHVRSATVRAPSIGQWLARIWLEDSAGNASASNVGEAILRLDDKPPTVRLQRPSADRPALISVMAADEGSGLHTREIFARRRGSSAWISLSVTSQPTGFSAVVDDEQLPRGIYELRAHAVDFAGNERSTDRLADGTVAAIKLPARVTTTLRVGRPKRVRARGANGKRRTRIKLVASPQASYGRTIPLRGRLTSPGGNPLAGRDVQVLEQTSLPAAPWRPIAVVTTSRTGRFTFRALRGPSRTLRFRFGGSDTIRGRTADVTLGVRAATSMRVSRHRVVNGEGVTFRGRLRGRPLPEPGKLIELQAFARGRWLTFGTTRARRATGRWSYAYRFSATRGNVRYRFRARLPKETGYAYETGTSKPVRVTVRGL